MWKQLRKWLGRRPESTAARAHSIAWVPQADLPSRPLSYPYTPLSFLAQDARDDHFVDPPGVDPRVAFSLYRYMRETIPDVSAGIWAWVRLCSTPQTFSLIGGTEAEQEEARQLLTNLDRRLFAFQHERVRGVEALLECFFLSVFTCGSFGGEIVLDPLRRGLDQFVVIDPATIRFKLSKKTREYLPYQLQEDGTFVALNPASFYYYGLDTDGLTPYGRSPLSAIPLVVRIQQQLIQDMARAQHNAGYPTIHFRLTTPERERGESFNAYHERLHQEIAKVRDEVENKRADSNLITYDNLQVIYVGPDGQRQQWPESIQVISEQVISALHLAPFMIGRNWGTTETWGTAQYQLLTSNARSVQEGARRMAEWIRNLELILKGSPCQVTHHFAPHHHLDAAERARAFRSAAQTLTLLCEKGLLETAEARQRVETMMRFL